MFDKEREFLNKELRIDIPSRMAFMNRMCIKMLDVKGNWRTIYRIKVRGEEISLQKDDSEILKEVKFKTWSDIVEDNKERLLELEKNSLNTIATYRDRFKDYIPSVPVSGGKDSAIVHYLVDKTIANKETIFSNTTNETHHTYKYIKKRTILMLG